MKLYDFQSAPNPRRVRVYLAEKGISFGPEGDVDITLVNTDIMTGAHKTPEFLEKNDNGQIPVLELDDGTCITESLSICRYLEALYPQTPLFGTDPVSMALIDVQLRRIELQLFRSIGTSWVNGPVVAKVAAGRFKQIPEAKEQSDAATHAYYRKLDKLLANQAMMVGDEYTVVDTTAMCMIDFAATMVGLPPDTSLEHLGRWLESVRGRPSAQA